VPGQFRRLEDKLYIYKMNIKNYNTIYRLETANIEIIFVSRSDFFLKKEYKVISRTTYLFDFTQIKDFIYVSGYEQIYYISR